MRLRNQIIGFSFFFSVFILLFPQLSYAATTPFKSASIVTTDTLGTFYTNLSNCSLTDGLTCDRALSNSYGNLYFRNFGNYSDFGIPNGLKITKLRIRVTGKMSLGGYVGLSAGKTFTENCQWPSDLWSMFGNSSINTRVFVAPVVDEFQVGAIRSYCLTESNFENKNFVFIINFSSVNNWSANIDNFEIAFDYNPPITRTPTPSPTNTPTPTPIPTATPTPTPSGPEPFLDLPWDYAGQGKTFDEVALNPFSWFDHEYPLQNFCCDPPVMKYTGEAKNEFYRSHNGYDYSAKNGVIIDTPVLAAASGTATVKFASHSGGAGNVIKIDHGNG